MLEFTFILPLLQLSFSSCGDPIRCCFKIRQKSSKKQCSAPCLLTSLYRSLQGEYHVHRPHFTGRPSGFGVMGSCKVCQPLFTGPPWQVPSQSISHYRPLDLVRKILKNKIVQIPEKQCGNVQINVSLKDFLARRFYDSQTIIEYL